MPRRLIPMLALLAGCAGTSSSPPPAESHPEPAPRRTPRPAPPPEAKNVIFTRPPVEAGRVPTLRSIVLPDVHAGAAVWGSTGRDHRGHIYFGISTQSDGDLSAHLIDYDPVTGRATDRGGAVENLKRLHLDRPDENQNKIHSKVWQAADGYLYFASVDEGGENEDGSKLPTFGSHLWRVKPDGGDWEHLAAVPEGLVASALGGQYVYFLGYFGHVLYQWDVPTGRLTNSVRVGSAGGHVSRNFFADSRGHAFVPRVTGDKAALVEYDEQLREQAAFPLEGYGTAPNSGSHGVVGVAQLTDDGLAFVTDGGRLYRVTPRATGTAVTDLGNIHPDGGSYCASLFSYDGESTVVGLARRPSGQAPRDYDWVTFDLHTRRATTARVVVPIDGVWRDLLIYGSLTRDDDGRCYVGGRYIASTANGDRSVPAAWQVVP